MAVLKKEAHAKVVHKYFEGIGRRKTATARVRISKGEAAPTVNGKPITEYFQASRLTDMAMLPIAELKMTNQFSVSAKVFGGGIHAQADAVRHGLARALVEFDPELKARLRIVGMMTRDPRMVERKKFGLRKARRAPQWQKR